MRLLRMEIMCWMDTKTRSKLGYFDHRRRHHHQCTRQTDTTTATDLTDETRQGNFSDMASSWCNKKTSPISVSVLLCFLLLLASSNIRPVFSSETGGSHATNQTFRPQEELRKLEIIREHLDKINKPAVKSIQSPDGDLIDCVLSHLQPAFDHPRLKGQKPLEPPERPKDHDHTGMVTENFQSWSFSGESCPEGTVPIRRTTEQDMLRASSVRRFGRKPRRHVRRDTNSNGHEHAVGYVTGEQYYGAKASINVWAPRVFNQYEFSLSQLWVISGSFGDDLNTIEAGWQVSPELYGDNYPRFFTYWTSDAYQATGCYNFAVLRLCSNQQ
ncbi:hypothetical protein OIU76_011044 [Salix suchowensis]|nr:hypothetical protein OIU76_011044 [Salix suchowensis]